MHSPHNVNGGWPPRLVGSVDDMISSARRAAAGVPAHEHSQRATDELLKAMRTVKAARFSAAERYERKHALSLFAMSIVSLYFVGLSVWQAIYAPVLDEVATRLLTLVSIMSSVFTLVLALIEAMNDYKIKAHHMHGCALAVNDLYHEFKLARPADHGTVQEFRRRYNEVVRGCPINHSRVDYLIAKASRRSPFSEWAWARFRYAMDVYALYGAALIIPPLVLYVFR